MFEAKYPFKKTLKNNIKLPFQTLTSLSDKTQNFHKSDYTMKNSNQIPPYITDKTLNCFDIKIPLANVFVINLTYQKTNKII